MKREAAKNSQVTYPGVMMKQSSNNFLMPLLDSNINRCKSILEKSIQNISLLILT